MLYSLTLFVHILALAGAFFLSGVLLMGTRRLRATSDRREALGVLAWIASIAKGFPLVGLLLLASGAMMARAQWSFGEGWIVVGIVVLVAMMVNGAVVIGGRDRRLIQALSTRSDTSLDAAERALLHDTVHDVAENVNIGLAIAMVLVMVLKAPLLGSAAIAVAFALAAAGLTVMFGNSSTSAAIEPASADGG